MKVLLIETGNAREDPFAQCWYTPESKRFTVPLLALPILAGLTPRRFEVELLDEKVRDVDLEADCDLVCFSFKTKDAPRTYRYAQRFRERGVPVVLGGVHATLAPDEARQHADSVVAGEAEAIWPKVLDDFEHGQLQPLYHAQRGGSLETPGLPRFELLENDRYALHAVQTSRGCLVGCEFCPIHKMSGGTSRHKPVKRVLDEVAAAKEIDRSKMIFFVDEMFCGGDTGYQKNLLAKLRPTKTDFLMITDFKVISPGYIADLARSGCRKMSINMPGTCLPQELKAVKAIQRLGIDVWGFFMFGFSFHDKSVFQRVVDFAGESGMKHLTLTVMSPFPNTPMDRAVAARNGYLSKDWSLYDQCHVVCEPEKMTAKELEDGFHRAWEQLEARIPIRERTFDRGGRALRTVKRTLGAATLALEHAAERLLRPAEQPVDLLSIVGKPKVEVSVTTHNTMGGQHAKY